jgi:magnesium chelatase family protein
MKRCPCGYAGTPRCNCTPTAIDRYLRRISGPLLDRIDLRVHVPAVSYAELRPGSPPPPECQSTAQLQAQVEVARAAQTERFGAGSTRLNSTLGPRELRRHCRTDEEADDLLRTSVDDGNLSARGVTRILRVARTMADLRSAERVERIDVLMALKWRVELKTVE